MKLNPLSMGEMVDHHLLPQNPNDWLMHHNNDNFLFPPINHENLQIPSHETIPHSPPPSSSSSPFDSQLRKGSDFMGWLSIGLQILRSKFLSTLSSFRNHRRAIWSFGVPTAALVMSCWVFVAMRKKSRSLTSNEARLINIIKEKDGKIAQLLHQIAQMNKILIDRHKALAAKVVE